MTTKAELVRNMIDCEGAESLCKLYLSLLVGKDFDDPTFEENEDFIALTMDYDPSDL